MKITRRPLPLQSALYSREFDVERSAGCHLMEIVTYIAQSTGIEKKHSPELVPFLDRLAFPGFIWEHFVSRAEDKHMKRLQHSVEFFEHAFAVEAMRMEMLHRPELVFPGEMFYCVQCDDVMTGGQYAREHCATRKHKGIFSTPDALNVRRERYAEWKFTWKSANQTSDDGMDGDGVWRWPVQCMWNCMTLDVKGAEMKTFFCNGDYTPGPPKPLAFEFDLDFDDREIRRNTAMIITTAKKLGRI